MSAIYASPNRSLRPAIWEQIGAIQHFYPWLLIGDFNCTIRDGERNTPGGVSTGFVDWLHRLSLIDVDYSDPVYTWNHGRSVEIRRSARLDRAFCDDEWRRCFPETSLRHLPHSYSDHCPILLQTSAESSVGVGGRPFRFVAAWMEHKGFAGLVRSTWSNQINVVESLHNLS